MSINGEQDKSDLFLLRLWAGNAGEQAGDGADARGEGREGNEACMWHGRLLHVLSGEGHNFDGWQGLVEVLREMVSSPDEQLPESGHGD
jgi:hypothetical protein